MLYFCPVSVSVSYHFDTSLLNLCLTLGLHDSGTEQLLQHTRDVDPLPLPFVGLPSPIQMPAGPPQFPGMEEMGVGASRAKRYSSQRQRPVPEPGPPLHLGVMEGHYYEPSKRIGSITTYRHSNPRSYGGG